MPLFELAGQLVWQFETIGNSVCVGITEGGGRGGVFVLLRLYALSLFNQPPILGATLMLQL